MPEAVTVPVEIDKVVERAEVEPVPPNVIVVHVKIPAPTFNITGLAAGRDKLTDPDKAIVKPFSARVLLVAVVLNDNEAAVTLPCKEAIPPVFEKVIPPDVVKPAILWAVAPLIVIVELPALRNVPLLIKSLTKVKA